MIRLERLKTWFLIAVLAICGTASFASCSSNEENATEQSNITTIADKVWAFSQAHPDGFTIDIRTMTELFPEDDLKGAIQFGKENGQYSVFILSTYTEIPIDGK
jgi:hypothetical protein